MISGLSQQINNINIKNVENDATLSTSFLKKSAKQASTYLHFLLSYFLNTSRLKVVLVGKRWSNELR